MIAEDAVALEALAGEVAALRRSQQHGEAIVNRTKIVRELLKRASDAEASGQALADRLSEPRATPPQTAAAVAKILEWRAALDDDLSTALGGELFGSFKDATETAVREIERQTTAAWQRYIAHVTPDTPAAILAALQADPHARSTVRTIEGLAQSINRLRERSIPTVDELTEFDTAVADLRTAWATLDVASLNDEIVTFLREANGDHGAALRLLTSTVVDWLEQRDVVTRYVIRPADPA
jgi:hypothetical protein